MALTRNLRRTGAAASIERAEEEMRRWNMNEIHRQLVREGLDAEERQYMRALADIVGQDVFENWYDSPEVPEYGPISERLALIQEQIALALDGQGLACLPRCCCYEIAGDNPGCQVHAKAAG